MNHPTPNWLGSNAQCVAHGKTNIRRGLNPIPVECRKRIRSHFVSRVSRVSRSLLLPVPDECRECRVRKKASARRKSERAQIGLHRCRIASPPAPSQRRGAAENTAAHRCSPFPAASRTQLDVIPQVLPDLVMSRSSVRIGSSASHFHSADAGLPLCDEFRSEQSLLLQAVQGPQRVGESRALGRHVLARSRRQYRQ
jgi:hypothetical protein